MLNCELIKILNYLRQKPLKLPQKANFIKLKRIEAIVIRDWKFLINF